MKIEEFKTGELIRILDNSMIIQGNIHWKNGDVVEIREVDTFYNRLDVWRKDKFLSEFIYDYELNAIEKVGEWH